MACRRQVSTAKAVDEDEPSAAAVVGAAKGRLVSAMMKKHLCEAVVPVIIDLKRLLEARRHPLLGDLMAAIRALLKDYKSEVRRGPFRILVGSSACSLGRL